MEQQQRKLEEADAPRLADVFERRVIEAYAKRERGEELSGFDRYLLLGLKVHPRRGLERKYIKVAQA